MNHEQRNKALNIVIVCCIVLLISLAVFVNDTEKEWQEKQAVTHTVSSVPALQFTESGSINGHAFTLAVADTSVQRIQGLSGQISLPQNHGLLFIFEYASNWGIWMKDMNFAIDIVWLDQNLVITHIEEGITPETYPTNFKPRSASRFVLELPAGTVMTHQIKTGDRMEVSENIQKSFQIEP